MKKLHARLFRMKESIERWKWVIGFIDICYEETLDVWRIDKGTFDFWHCEDFRDRYIPFLKQDLK